MSRDKRDRDDDVPDGAEQGRGLRLLGMSLRLPTLAAGAGFIGLAGVLCILVRIVEAGMPQDSGTDLTFVYTGIIAGVAGSALGADVSRHGWRAAAIVAGLALVIGTAMRALGG